MRETKRYTGHTDKVSGLNELKNLATREKLEVWGINSTLGTYQMAVYLWNSGNVVLYKICIWPIEQTYVSVRPQASRPLYLIVYEA